MKYHEIACTVPDLQMDVEGMQFPEKLFIQSYDIGIILGDALDNGSVVGGITCINSKK